MYYNSVLDTTDFARVRSIKVHTDLSVDTVMDVVQGPADMNLEQPEEEQETTLPEIASQSQEEETPPVAIDMDLEVPPVSEKQGEELFDIKIILPAVYDKTRILFFFQHKATKVA